jgi:hypothetical protein
MALHQDHVTLNPNQRQRLLVTCRHIDKLLADVEATLGAAASKSVFPSYVNDLRQDERNAVEQHVARLRGQLLAILAGQSILPDEPHISARHSIHVGLTFIEIAIAELAPEHMRGYGPVSAEGRNDLRKVIAELQSTVRDLYAALQTYSDVPVGNTGTGS